MKIKNLYKKLISITTKNTGIVLFLFMLMVAAFTFTEYGISWDEGTQRNLGVGAYDYIVGKDKRYISNKDKDYGIFFELGLISIEKSIEKIFVYQGYPEKFRYLLRHFITHIFFLLSAFFAYKLVYFLYKNKWLATIVFFLIVLHPRIYTNSFFNTKDIPFLSTLIISLYCTAIALKRKTIKNFLVLGIITGILINIRIIGIMLPCLVFFFLLIDMINEKKYIQYTKLIFLLLGTSLIVLYITWPYLWNNPIDNFINAFNNMKNFRHYSSQLFLGDMFPAYAVPKVYIPIWFTITTPITYLFFGLTGVILIILHFIKKPIHFLFDLQKRLFLICLSIFIAPVILAIVFNSTLYNGWRHLYFIYVGFVFIAIYSIHFFMQKNKKIIYILFASFIFSAIYMIQAYPIQHTYFNQFISKKDNNISNNFEMDYWGVSAKQAFEYILKNDNTLRPTIKIYKRISDGYDYGPFYNNYYGILTTEERKKIILENDINKADYFIIYSDRYLKKKFTFPPTNFKKIHTIKRQKNTILDIYKIIEH